MWHLFNLRGEGGGSSFYSQGWFTEICRSVSHVTSLSSLHTDIKCIKYDMVRPNVPAAFNTARSLLPKINSPRYSQHNPTLSHADVE